MAAFSKGYRNIPEALLALPLYEGLLFVCVRVHIWAPVNTTLLDDIGFSSIVTAQCELGANTCSSRVTKEKEHNAPKLDKAQCSFCCYSETQPSLSPTHICKIINRCPKSLLWRVYHKHTHFLPCRIIPFSQSPCLAPFLCISLKSHVHSGHKHLRILTEENKLSYSHSHICAQGLLRVLLRFVPSKE